ncbi:Single Cache domain 2 [seawater metagenome]|uniref:Single Cache domain 2 n=1 Tax=seawater metagenome TaxID=1561972 RepID=A0A5E8CL18_9ZZZZ
MYKNNSLNLIIVFVLVILMFYFIKPKNNYDIEKNSVCAHPNFIGGSINHTPPVQYKSEVLKTINFMDTGLNWIKNNEYMTNLEIFSNLNKEQNNNNYFIAYGTGSENKGILLMHAGKQLGKFCSVNDPKCEVNTESLIGKNLWNYKSLDGVFAVRIWVDLAKSGGGWYAYYWNDPKTGQIVPKYTYIKQVPNRNFLLATGFEIN